MACPWETGGVVESLSPLSVRRILNRHRLKPWRQHRWQAPKALRDAAFAEAVRNLSDLYSRTLASNEKVLCLDKKSSLPPGTRKAEILPPKPEKPMRVESEPERQGALHWFAAFPTRRGKVYPPSGEGKRQIAFLPWLGLLDREFDSAATTRINVRIRQGKLGGFQFHHTPAHCFWMNPAEPWFRILQRKRLGIANFAHKKDRAERSDALVRDGTRAPTPFAAPGSRSTRSWPSARTTESWQPGGLMEEPGLRCGALSSWHWHPESPATARVLAAPRIPPSTGSCRRHCDPCALASRRAGARAAPRDLHIP